MSAPGCEWMDEVAVELALGLLEGAERAEALAHVEQCGACQAEVASLTTVGERLLLLAPEVPPPAGFETRVLERIASAPERLRALGRSGADSSDAASDDVAPAVRRHWLRRSAGNGARAGGGGGRRPWMMMAAAAAVVAMLFVGLGTGLLTDDEPRRTTADMISNRTGSPVGEVTLLNTDPLTVEVDAQEWIDALKQEDRWVDGQWWLTVRDDRGDKDLYEISFADSPATVTLNHDSDSGPLEFGDVTEIALLDSDGREWCTARL